MKSGLVSVTFNQLDADGVLSLAEEAGVKAIEWSAKLHVKPGCEKEALRVGAATRDAGMTPIYGSYCYLTREERASGDFERVSDTASALGAHLVRVWAGRRASADADEAAWEEIIESSLYMSDIARARGLEIAYEYHGNTLTDTRASARRLLEAAPRGNIYSMWQPPVGMSREGNLLGIADLGARLKNAHVFTWRERERLALADGEADWREYLRALSGERYALIEFVKGDSPEQFKIDARSLKRWLAEE